MVDEIEFDIMDIEEYHIDDEEFDLDKNGYPTEETLFTTENWPYEKGFKQLLENITPLVNGYGKLTTHALKDNLWIFVTGGWSGNESISQALHANRIFWSMCWQVSKRGGYYEFEVKR